MDLTGYLQPVDLSAIDDHVFELHVTHHPPDAQTLGYVDKSTDQLHLSLVNGDEVTIQQSRSSLSGQALSTGFVCWQLARYLVDWLLDDDCPFSGFFRTPDYKVLELGAGVSALLAAVLGPKCKKYVATDQKPILKLLRLNLEENVVSRRWNSRTLEWLQTGKASDTTIDIVELDWEKHDLHEVFDILDGYPDLVIATDTIYNEYLVPFFVETLSALMGPASKALVTVQLRDESITTRFVEQLAAHNLSAYTIEDQYLPRALLAGFAVYYITK